jgi:CPA2 family monovalent cation:H+ antiporter-2
MGEARALVTDLALVLGLAALITVVFRWLRQPVVLGYLLAGLIVGPHVPIPVFVDQSRIHSLSELGVILVMFSVGLHFSVRELVRVAPTAGLTGAIQVGAVLWLGYAVGQALGWTPVESLFGGAIAAISSTIIVARVFSEHGIRGPVANLVFGVLVIEDLAAVLLLAALTPLVSSGSGEDGTLLWTAGRLAAFLLALVVGGFLTVPRALHAVARLQSPETLLVASVGLCFGFALLADAAGYSVALGAFLAGSLVAESGESRTIERLIAPLRDVFGAVFFVSVGMLVEPAAMLDQWSAIIALVLVVLVGRAASTFGALLAGYDVRTSLQAALCLTQIGEFSFIIAGLGVKSGAVGGFLYTAAVAASALTAFASPVLIARSSRIAAALDRRLPRRVRTFLSLYGAWRERLRVRASGDGARARRLRLGGWLGVDALAIAAIAVGAAVAMPRLASSVALLSGASPRVASLGIGIGAALLASPFAFGVARSARALGALLAASALPTAAEGRLDLAAAPRRALVVGLQLSLVLVVAIPLLALTAPFLPLRVGAGIAALLVCALAFSFWRSAADLEEHVRAGAETIVGALARQARERRPHTLAPLEAILPGLGDLVLVEIESGSVAAGQTLADLDLRGLTGATALAISRGEAGVAAPTGREILRAGDVLALAGSSDAIERARARLRDRTPLARAPVPSEAPA